MGEEIVHVWGPLVVAIFSIVISIIGVYLKKREVTTAHETQQIDQIIKINSDLRSELTRKDEVIDNLADRVKVLEKELLEKREELFDTFIKLHKQGQ